MTIRRVILLGSTGSIGTQTLEVIEHLNSQPDAGTRYRVVGLAAGSNAALLMDQAARWGVRDLALCTGSAAGDGRLRLGTQGAERLVREVECDIVLGAMVGAAGLPATIAAVELGRDVALANKEPLVMAGELVVRAAKAGGARLLPVDSEHSGVWQALGEACVPPYECGGHVSKVILTASGGPFRLSSIDEMRRATPAQALRHPTWTMGRKVTIDSASLMNKALELLEAHWLFGLSADRLGALIHPQSVVHALVEHVDGSVVAQLGVADMRLPIQLALTWPQRRPGATRRLDLASTARLDFEPVDAHRFPAVDMALEAIRRGGTAGAILNGANEAAVKAFLEAGSIPFGRISELVAEAMARVEVRRVSSLGDVLEADRAARACVNAAIR